MIDKKLLSILVCPTCKGELQYDKKAAELICFSDGMAYPIKDDVPVMLAAEAREISAEERENRGQL